MEFRNRKGSGKPGHIVADTLLPMMFLGLRKLGNICCGHKIFLNKIRNIFCVLDTKFAGVRNKCCARGQTAKHLCRQQCVRNNVSSFARALTSVLFYLLLSQSAISLQQIWQKYIYYFCREHNFSASRWCPTKYEFSLKSQRLKHETRTVIFTDED